MDLPDVQPDDCEVALAHRIAGAGPGPGPGDAERESAEAELCRRLAPRIRLYGLRHLRDRHAAADLVQHVLLVTLEGLRAGRVREPSRLVSFVFGACRVALLELRRGQARRDRLLQRYAADVPVADASVAARTDHERVLECLDRLPERERSVLVMTFYDERSADEVGRELGLAAGNVRVIRHRGIRHLRDCVVGGKGLA
jgi:RNA polymerase sigma-70 factor, ECF subfamily